MPRTFLPPLRSGGGIALPQTHSHDFVGGDDSLIGDIQANMNPSDANSEGRAPSPFARVWQFRRNLEGDAGGLEQARALAAFRGILALFALRQYYHLKIEADLTPRLTADPVMGDSRVSRLFELHTSHLPEPAGGEHARFLFGERLVFFRLAEPSGTPDSVVAGYSPLTLFYPAARSLQESRALNAIFWYDRAAGRWHDPANPPEGTQRRLSQEARAHLAAWLDDALAARLPGGQRLAILEADRLAPADDRFLAGLLAAWRKELGVISAGPAGQIQTSLLAKSAQMQNVERSEGGVFQVPQLLEKVYQGEARPSDFPERNDVLVLTLEQAENASHRVYGNVFGSPEIRGKLAAAPAEGPDLGAAMGRPGEAPVAYVTLDRLFSPKLGRIESGTNTISLEWSALRLLDAPGLSGIYLLPFEPAILRYFTAQEIRDGTEAKPNVAAAEVIFQSDGLRVSRLYDLRTEINTLDPSLDLRFFPNFRLDFLADPERQLPFAEDRNYYARLRLSPDFDRLPMRWLSTAGAPLANALAYFTGDYDQPADPNLLALGRQAFWRLPIKTPPGAFQIEGFGLLLLTLRGSDHQGETPRSWTVALDFGTTNSCVAVDVGAENTDSAYRLPVFTTPLLSQGRYELRGKSHEGASAMADFMFWQKADASVLNQNEFFPTQILTRHRLDLEKLPYPDGFDERNGLAFFPNVSLAAVEQRGFIDLIESFDAMRTSSVVKARFKLKRNLKWKDGRDGLNSLLWRRVFHQHLRLHLILAAAAENAWIGRMVASFPKAFLPAEVHDYQQELEKIWGSSTAGDDTRNSAKTSGTTVELRSESAAAALALGVARGQEFFLLDMGGGTTDVAVFKDNVLEEECSLTLAGQVLERYVCQSQALRQAMAKDFEGWSGDGKKAFMAPSQPDQVYQTLFQGFLVKNGVAQALLPLRNREGKEPAVQGFFLSAVFLYTGLAYFCGLWLAKRRQGGEGITAEERLQWLGNGSSFIHMLGVADKSFEDVLVGMFNAACDGTAKVSRLRPDAKTVVAKGLLKAPVVRSAAGDQQVFAHLLSDSVTLAGKVWPENEMLGNFYRQFNARAAVSWDGLAEGKVFRQYLKALQIQLPMAKLNKSPLVNIGALGVQDASQWAVDYVTSQRAGVEKEFIERLKDNRDRWSEVLHSGTADILYVEPLFVSELAALLEQIRESHA